MWKSVKEYVIDAANSPEGEIRVALWVSPDGELGIDVAGADEMMELEVAEEVRSKISRLLRFRTSEKGLKLIAKRLRIAKEELAAIEKRLEPSSREVRAAAELRKARVAAALRKAAKREEADKRR